MGNSLKHYGVKGMKWGVRRYQNEDGTLTKAGKKREAKARKHDKRAEEYERLAETNPYYSEDYRREAQKERKEAENIRNGKLTRKQKYALPLAGCDDIYCVPQGSRREVRDGSGQHPSICQANPRTRE